jgi:dihydrofolate reductase
MVIGGAAVFAEALPIADRIELTEVALTPEGDVHMPPIDRTQWTETARTDVPVRPGRPGFSFVTLARVGGPAADDAS